MKIRPEPCSSCPYRTDVPSGLWAANEYAKLVEYDAPTAQQPLASFACHATPDAMCCGWAVVHSNRGREYELLALRLRRARRADIPTPTVKLFASAADAAAHGIADIDAPSVEARDAVARLLRKYPRLQEGGVQ